MTRASPNGSRSENRRLHERSDITTFVLVTWFC